MHIMPINVCCSSYFTATDCVDLLSATEALYLQAVCLMFERPGNPAATVCSGDDCDKTHPSYYSSPLWVHD